MLQIMHSEIKSVAFHMLHGKQKDLVSVVCKNPENSDMHHIWHFKVLLEEDDANNSFVLNSC